MQGTAFLMSQLLSRGVGASQGMSGMSLEVCKQGWGEHCCGCGSRKSGSDWKTSPLSLSQQEPTDRQQRQHCTGWGQLGLAVFLGNPRRGH